MVPEFDPTAFARESESKLAVEAPRSERRTVSRIKSLMTRGAYQEALDLANAMLAMMPLHAQAGELAVACTGALEKHYVERLGSTSVVPRLAASPEAIKARALDHVEGFLLAQIDGVTEVETLLDVSGLPRWMALRVICDLVERGIVRVA